MSEGRTPMSSRNPYPFPQPEGDHQFRNDDPQIKSRKIKSNSEVSPEN